MQSDDISLQKTFRYFEWISIAMLALTQYAWTNYVVQIDPLIMVSFSILALELPLSVWTPQSARLRLLQIAVQAILLAVASALGIHQHAALYFLVLGAKAAIILPTRQALGCAALLLCGRIVSGMISQHLFHHGHLHRGHVPIIYNDLILESELKTYFAISLFAVIFLGRTLVAEQRSRAAQQALSEEAKKLAIDFERNKISQSVHESLGHILASQLIQLELALKLVGDKQFEKARGLVDKSYDSSVRCLQELRKNVTAMRSSDGAE